ncbi:phage tail sheath C-terminal domain-containing protein [Caulobacter sp. NIBR1757]|uniref:phage tail sheath family protein n=1 Tax=Caulobacter sp. NIBR1757 TaxID=3016000 RepID=UPI0022F106B3|nr:phage tail sheath C-terminal domain-containing protein [Caulobacter sp. NIBR1757]WGM40475.1 hypothetical protein AMEJIAPC_03420 [Caulobacter sp. NIBR1757]
MSNLEFPGVYVTPLVTPVSAITSVPTSNTVFIGAAETGAFNTPTLVTSWNQYLATFGGLVWGAQMPFAVFSFFAHGGSVCYVVRAGTDAAGLETPASLTAGPLQISAASPGPWGDSLAVTISDAPPAGAGGAPSPTFAVNVYYRTPATGAVLSVSDQLFAAYASSNALPAQGFGGETYSLIESFGPFSAADLQGVAGAPSNIEIRINQASMFIRVAATAATRPANLAQPTALSGGAGDPVAGAPYLATALGALDLLTDASLLCAPETVWIADLGLQRAAVQQVLAWCDARPRKDLFYIADTPFGLSTPEADAFKTGAASPDGVVPAGAALTSSHGAIYYPWITVLNPLSNGIVAIAPSGAMAGLYAQTDASVGPWKAAAGITNGALSGATAVVATVTDADQDILNPDGVNAIRMFANYGVCAYGAGTMASSAMPGDPDLTYISVRRLLTMIELSVSNGLQWVAFEPTSPALWSTVSRGVRLYLTGLWQEGALFGATAAAAFSVQCDAANNTPADQAAGLLNVDIMVAPMHPAEFVVLRVQVATLASS